MAHPATSDEEPRERTGPWAWTWRLGLGAVSILVARHLCEAIDPLQEEPLPLRWLRILAAHPVRGAIAVALLLHAVLPGARGVASREPAEPVPPRPDAGNGRPE